MKQRSHYQTLTSLFTAIVLVLGITALPVTGQENNLTDMEITNAVSDELMEDPAVISDNIDIETKDGVVTLSGDATNILAKQRAEEIASMVKGVEGIVNTVDVRTPIRADVEIEEDIMEALAADAATESWELAVEVSDGQVTLTGAVESWQEKQLAANIAKSVRGVTGLQNALTVNYEGDRPDAEIKNEIEAALNWDAYIDDALITVSVDDGEASLSGTVGSVAEKNRATTEAWVAGVDSVDSEALNVRLWARDETLRENKYVSRSEEEIREAVNKTFLYDPRVYNQAVDVEVDEGTVTLRGEVDNLKARRAAAADARSVVGVWSIKNQLKVRAGAISDARIERNVENAIERDPYLNRYEVTVSVTDGEVYLYGGVNSSFEKSRADDIAGRQTAVAKVHNHLVVNTTTATRYGPYTEEPYAYDYDWYEFGEDTAGLKNDWELERDINNELFWSPFVEQEDVQVSVDEGIATLTGTVDTWGERQAARENALEAGAIAVKNELDVEFGPNYYSP